MNYLKRLEGTKTVLKELYDNGKIEMNDFDFTNNEYVTILQYAEDSGFINGLRFSGTKMV